MKKILALFLTLLLIGSCGSSVAAAESNERVEIKASDYLDSYCAYIYAAGDGDIQIWFEVAAKGIMDEIGALTIILKESTNGSTWTTVRTFKHENYSNMLVSNRAFYTSCVNYSGVSGRYYKAYVTIWAGENGGGDSRQIITSTVIA